MDLRVEIVDVRVCLKSVAVMFNHFQKIAPTNCSLSSSALVCLWEKGG